MANTPKRGLPQPVGGDLIATGDDILSAAFLVLDDAAFWTAGTLGSRPTAATAKAGTMYFATDGPRIDVSDGTSWKRVWPLDDLEVTLAKLSTELQATVPARGDYKYSLQTADHGALGGGLFAWLVADGRETPVGYTNLIADLDAAGSPFGVGGGGRPRLPDFRGRAPVHPDGTAGRLDANDALGQGGGEQKHLIVIGEVPSHAHTVTDSGHVHGYTDPGHGHIVSNQGYGLVTARPPGWGGPEILVGQTSPYLTFPVTPLATSGSGVGITIAASGTGISLQTAGGSGSHNNMQPYIVGGSWFVKS